MLASLKMNVQVKENTLSAAAEEGWINSTCLRNGPYAKFLNRAHLFLKRGAGDLIFTTCDCYSLNNIVFNFGAHS